MIIRVLDCIFRWLKELFIKKGNFRGVCWLGDDDVVMDLWGLKGLDYI